MTKSQFVLLFITLLALIHCQEDHDEDHEDHHEEENHLTNPQIWGFGFLAGLGVSLIGFIAAILLLIIKKCLSDTIFNTIVKFLFALACGALLGDAVVHIMAESYAN